MPKRRRPQAARKAKDAAGIQRHEFVLAAVIALSPKLQQHLTGEPTIEQLVQDVGEKLGRPVTEATIRHDILVLGPALQRVLKP